MRRISLIILFALAAWGCKWRQIPVIGWFFGGQAGASAGVPGGPPPGNPPGTDAPPADITGGAIATLAAWASVIGAAALVACPAIFFFVPGFRSCVPRLAVAAIGTLVAAQILVWVGAHLAWLAAVFLVLALVLAFWRKRVPFIQAAERLTGRDLDGDAVVGTPVTDGPRVGGPGPMTSDVLPP